MLDHPQQEWYFDDMKMTVPRCSSERSAHALGKYIQLDSTTWREDLLDYLQVSCGRS